MLSHGLRLVFLGAFFSVAQAQALDPLQSKHEQAVRELSSLHFFQDHRGMHIAPGIINQLDWVAKKILPGINAEDRFAELMTHRWGILSKPKTATQKLELIGLYNVPDFDGQKMRAIGVLGCVACHSGRANGEWIVGIGNKNIDVGQIGKDSVLVQGIWKTATDITIKKTDIYRSIEDSAMTFTRRLSDPRLSNHTQGLVATSVIRDWFYRQAGVERPSDMPLALVKVPHLFGYAEKRKVGQFADGGGDGNFAGWGAAVELTAGQTPETVRAYKEKLEHAEDLLGYLQPPKYPGAIDRAKAVRGKLVFEQSCAHCHGSYTFDAQNHPIYTAPKLISQSIVKTDSNRLTLIKGSFFSLVQENPLNDLLRPTENSGQNKYFAPKLYGIWARFPYLHNASVPTVADLLSPVGSRPKQFSLRNAGEKERFDSHRLGLKVVSTTKPSRDSYDVTREGASNEGHEFGLDLTETEKFELIEYLKQL